jgi:sec-independent protein translocase protein TatA
MARRHRSADRPEAGAHVPEGGNPMLRNGLEPWHLLIVAIVVIMMFGAKKLPDTARALGKSMRILKSEASAMREESARDEKAATVGTQEAGVQSAGAAAPAAPASPVTKSAAATTAPEAPEAPAPRGAAHSEPAGTPAAEPVAVAQTTTGPAQAVTSSRKA